MRYQVWFYMRVEYSSSMAARQLGSPRALRYVQGTGDSIMLGKQWPTLARVVMLCLLVMGLIDTTPLGRGGVLGA